jgi:hypothetical protein
MSGAAGAQTAGGPGPSSPGPNTKVSVPQGSAPGALSRGQVSGTPLLPDLSADADPYTGYLPCDPLACPALSSGNGGTSYVAPQLAASAAVINQYLGGRTPGQIFNPGSGLGVPNLAALAADFGHP